MSFNYAELAKTGLQAGNVLATQPDLFNHLVQHLTKTVKRDEVTKNVVLLTGISAYTREPINLFLRGESSIGKTYNATEGLKYFPDEDVWMLGDLSPTALIHAYGDLVDEHGKAISWAEKPGKDAAPEDKKIWEEKLKNSRYIIDLKGKILVFLEAPKRKTYEMLRPILSHDKHEISYKITDPERLKTKHTVIRGWPATFFCSSAHTYMHDLVTRGFTITPQTGSEKYRDANALTGKKEAFPWAFKQEEDLDFQQLQSYIRWLSHKLQEISVCVPYAQQLAKKFPTDYARSMRDYKHLLSLIEVYTLFHPYQKPAVIRKLKDGEHTERYVLATRPDYEYVYDLWKKIEETTITGLPGHVVDFYHNAVKPLYDKQLRTIEKARQKIREEDRPEDDPKIQFTTKELMEKYNEDAEEPKSSDTIRDWVDLLCQIGWLSKDPDPLDKRRNLITVIKRQTGKNGKNGIFKFSDIFTIESFKGWLNHAEQISEKNSILLRCDLLHEDTPPDIHIIWTRYYEPSRKFDDSSVIETEQKQVGLEELGAEIHENKKLVQFPVFKPKSLSELASKKGVQARGCWDCTNFTEDEGPYRAQGHCSAMGGSLLTEPTIFRIMREGCDEFTLKGVI